MKEDFLTKWLYPTSIFIVGLILSIFIFLHLNSNNKSVTERLIQLETDRFALLLERTLSDTNSELHRCLSTTYLSPTSTSQECFERFVIKENLELYGFLLSSEEELLFLKNINNNTYWGEWDRTKEIQGLGAKIKVKVKPNIAHLQISSSYVYLLILVLGVSLSFMLLLLYNSYRVLQIRNRTLVKAEKKFKDYNHLLNDKNQELEQYMYAASHDLQEPLNTIISFIDIIQEEYEDTLREKEMRQHFNFIIGASERMKLLIQGLLQHSKIGEKRQIEQIDIAILLKETIDDLSHAIQKSGAEISYPIVLPKIYGYPLELKLLFQNLLSNAIKYQKKGVSPIIILESDFTQKGWHFRIRDNGIGIDNKYKEVIFKLFQRLHSEKRYKGSGIGLAHCKKITQLHKGEIWVESKVGIGSTFHFVIPHNI